MSLQSFLNQAATLYPKSGYDAYGRDQSGSGTSLLCRFQNQTKTKILPNQEVIQLVGIIYLDGAVVVNTEDRITIGGASYKVFSVNGNVDGRGVQRMIKLEVTKWQT